jgi:hypothetical protein
VKVAMKKYVKIVILNVSNVRKRHVFSALKSVDYVTKNIALNVPWTLRKQNAIYAIKFFVIIAFQT